MTPKKKRGHTAESRAKMSRMLTRRRSCALCDRVIRTGAGVVVDGLFYHTTCGRKLAR